MSGTPPLLRIGRLARDAGVGKATIEHYLKLGLLMPAGVEGQGYRLFCADSLERIRMIKQARLAGFSLPEIGAMFNVVPLDELDELLTSLPLAKCRTELSARGVDVAAGVIS